MIHEKQDEEEDDLFVFLTENTLCFSKAELERPFVFCKAPEALSTDPAPFCSV